MKTIIEFKNVCKQYKTGEITTNAATNVNFSIDEGEFVIILGASGAGKSTMLNLLGGMDKVTSGQIIIDNQDITCLSEDKLSDFRRDKIGFVFQFYNLIGNLTAIENVEFASESCKKKLNATEIMEQVGLGKHQKNFPSQLSGGEQQRVAIARAVAKNPLLLLCDEPTGALDYTTSKQVLKLLTEINVKHKKTIVIITHNGALAAVADKVIKIRSGEVESITLNENKTPIEKIEW